ncbi:MAG TPA: DNA polymerase/3'-5' exonuclease PolX [Candidatus Acidoferrum sp.]|nr:DNA polymerase/3'-5' exonuclease PolX [Candidatus Acidoferrum sp.]
MENKKIAEIFDEIGDMLSLEDFPTARFEVRAYKKAALMISTMQEPIEEIYKKGGKEALMELPGIGKTMSNHIEEYIKTGKILKYEKLKKKYPIDMSGMTSITGLGAKRAILLYKKLGVKNIEDLKKALESHKIKELEGFGAKSEEVIGKGLSLLESSKGRMLLGYALPVAERVVEKLRKSGLVEKVMIAGSARRMRETIGDIDILAISKKNEEVMDFFTKMDEVDNVMSKGPTKSSVWLKIGMGCDLRVLEPQSFGAAVQYFTGSKDHNIQVRQLAVNKGWKLNEYGLFDKKNKNVGGSTEESIYEKLGMQYMPPEMREARGEVKLALEHKIPKLVELSDINGDLHTHTKETDGVNTLAELANAAVKNGLKYFATTNHSKSEYVARGMDDKKFKDFSKKVEKEKKEFEGKIEILYGAEVDILKDGSLDLSKNTLNSMDCVVGAIHSNFTMTQKEMTDRVIKGIESGLINIFAHPTGRLVGETQFHHPRAPYAIDLERVAEAAERNNVALEINSFPNRTDLNDTNIMLVSKYKIMFAIDTDAHMLSHLQFMRYGVGTARRGWLTKDRILNALPLKDLMKRLSK